MIKNESLLQCHVCGELERKSASVANIPITYTQVIL